MDNDNDFTSSTETSGRVIWYKNYKIWLGVGIGVAVISTGLVLYFLGVFDEDTKAIDFSSATNERPTEEKLPISLVVPPPPPEVHFCSPKLYGDRYLEFGTMNNVWWTDKELRDPETDQLSFIIEIWYVSADDLVLPEVIWIPKDDSNVIPLLVEPDTKLSKPGDRLYFRVFSFPLIRSMADSLRATVVKKSEIEQTYTFPLSLAQYEPLLSLSHRLNLDSSVTDSGLSTVTQIMKVTVEAPFDKKIPLSAIKLLVYIFPVTTQKSNYVYSDIEWQTEYIVATNDANNTLQMMYVAATPNAPERVELYWRLSQTDTRYNGGQWCIGLRTTNLIELGETNGLDIHTEWFGHTQPFTVVNLFTRYTNTLKLKQLWSQLSTDSKQVILTFVLHGLLPEDVTTDVAAEELFNNMDLYLQHPVRNTNASWEFLVDTDAVPTSTQVIRGHYFHSWIKRYNIHIYPTNGPAQVTLSYRHNVYEGGEFAFYNNLETTFDIPTKAQTQGGSSLGYLYQIYYFIQMEADGSIYNSTEAQLYNAAAHKTWCSFFISIFNGPLTITEDTGPLYVNGAPDYVEIVMIQMTDSYIEYRVEIRPEMPLPNPLPEFIYFTIHHRTERVRVGLRFNPPADTAGQPLILQTARVYNGFSLQPKVPLGTLASLNTDALHIRVYIFGGDGDYDVPIPDDQTISEVYAALLQWKANTDLIEYFTFNDLYEGTDTLEVALIKRWINIEDIEVKKQGTEKYIRYPLRLFHDRDTGVKFDFTEKFVGALNINLALKTLDTSPLIYAEEGLPLQCTLIRPPQYTPPVVSDIQIWSADGNGVELNNNVLQITKDQYQFLIKVKFAQLVKYNFQEHSNTIYKYVTNTEDTQEPAYNLKDRITIDKIVTSSGASSDASSSTTTEEKETRIASIGNTTQSSNRIYQALLTFHRPSDSNVYEVNQLKIRYNHSLQPADHELDESVSSSWNESLIEDFALKGVAANAIVIQDKNIEGKTPSFSEWCPGAELTIKVKWYATSTERDVNNTYPNIATLGVPNTRGLWEGITLGYRRLIFTMGTNTYEIWSNEGKTSEESQNFLKTTNVTYTPINEMASTLLTGALEAATTTINVNSTTGFDTSGIITIRSERIFYTGKTSTTFTGCTRGYGATTAVSHADTTQVTTETQGKYIEVKWGLKLLKDITPSTNISFQLQQKAMGGDLWTDTTKVQTYKIPYLDTGIFEIPFHYHIPTKPQSAYTFSSTAAQTMTFVLPQAFKYTQILESTDVTCIMKWTHGLLQNQTWSYGLVKGTASSGVGHMWQDGSSDTIRLQFQILLDHFGALPIETDVSASYYLTGVYNGVAWRIPHVVVPETFIGSLTLRRSLASISASSLYVYLPQLRHTQINPTANPEATVPDLCRRMTLCSQTITTTSGGASTSYGTLRAKDDVPRWFGGKKTLDASDPSVTEAKVKPVVMGMIATTTTTPYFKLLSENHSSQLVVDVTNGELTWDQKDAETTTAYGTNLTPYFVATPVQWDTDVTEKQAGYNRVGICYFDCAVGDTHVPTDPADNAYNRTERMMRNIHRSEKLGALHMKQPWPKKVVFPKLHLKAVILDSSHSIQSECPLFGVTAFQPDTLYTYGAALQEHMRGNTGASVSSKSLESTNNTRVSSGQTVQLVLPVSDNTELTREDWRHLYKNGSKYQFERASNEYACMIQCEAIAQILGSNRLLESAPTDMTLVLRVPDSDWKALDSTHTDATNYTLMHRNPLMRRSPGYTGGPFCGHYFGVWWQLHWFPTKNRSFLGINDEPGDQPWSNWEWANYVRAFDFSHGWSPHYRDLLIYPTIGHGSNALGKAPNNTCRAEKLSYINSTTTVTQDKDPTAVHEAVVTECNDWWDRSIYRLREKLAPEKPHTDRVYFRHAGFRVRQWTPYSVYRFFISNPSIQDKGYYEWNVFERKNVWIEKLEPQMDVVIPPTHKIEERYYNTLYHKKGVAGTVGDIAASTSYNTPPAELKTGITTTSTFTPTTGTTTQRWYGPEDKTDDISAASVQGYRVLPFDPLKIPPHGNVVVGSYKFYDTVPQTWKNSTSNARVPTTTVASTGHNFPTNTVEDNMSLKPYRDMHYERRGEFRMGFDLCTHDQTLVHSHWDDSQRKRVMTVAAMLSTQYYLDEDRNC